MKTITKTQSLRPLLTIKADDSGALPSQIEVLRTGMWDAPYHGQFMVTPQDLQQYIQNFANDVRPSSSTQGLPIDLDHDQGAAAGWMTSLTALPNDDGGWSLWANVTWTDLGQQALTGGQYAFFSPEFCPIGYIDPEGDDEPLDNVLIGGGLTNRPLFKDLQPVMASDQTDGKKRTNTQFVKMFISASEENGMPTLDEVRIKDAATLTDDEKKLLADSKDQLSQEEQDKFKDVLPTTTPETPAEPVTPETPAAPETPAPETNNNEENKPVSANDKANVTISASELETLKAAAAQGVAANERLKLKETQDHIDSKVFSASDGFKLKQDMRDEVVSLYLSANDEQKKTLDKLFDGMSPIKSAGEMAARGSASEFANGSAQKALNEKVAEIRANDSKIDYVSALLQARRENPEIAAQYDAQEATAQPAN